MNLESLKQALTDILNLERGGEAEPELLRYLKDVLAKLAHPSTIPSHVLVAFFTQLQTLLFQHEGEYINITFNEQDYRIQSLFRSFSIIEIEIQIALLTPLEIKVDTSQDQIQSLALTFIPPPATVVEAARAPSPITHTPEAREAMIRYATRASSIITEEPTLTPIGVTENNDVIMPHRRTDQAIGRARTGIHPLELDVSALIFNALSTFFGENEDNREQSHMHGFW